MKESLFSIALIGNPNCGKTALFNALTGSSHKVANYPGVTVEKKYARLTLAGDNANLIDLPGIYSLRGSSPDERLAKEALLGEIASEAKPDLVVFVADATNLSLNLRLVLEIQALGYPMVVALNMVDVAQKQGITIDTAKLSTLLGIPVVSTVAITKQGIDQLLVQLTTQRDQLATQHNPPPQAAVWQKPSAADLRKTYARVQTILLQTVTEKPWHHHLTERLDAILLHPLWGSLSLFVILFTMFQAVFSFAKSLQDWMQDKIDLSIHWLSITLPSGPLTSLITDGVLAGVGSVVVFLPQILCLFFFILILEDSGYMARAAFLMDRLMSKVGLNGKAFIPMLSSYACAVPGIMSARTIENLQDRMVTIMITPLTTCSARLPVYTLIIAAFIPHRAVWGLFNLQGLVMLALYVAGLMAALIMGFVFKRFVFKGKPPMMLMEMPLYRLPSLKNVLVGLWQRAKIFLYRAGTIILAVMILLWFLTSYPTAPADFSGPAVAYSFAGRVGHFLEPLFAPIGFNWQIVVALIPGLAAREAAIAGLGTVYALSGDDDALKHGLVQTLQHQWSLAMGLAILAWYVFAPQCISTLAVTKRETNSWRWPIVMFVYMLSLAYIAAFVVFHLSQWLFGS